MLTRAWKGQGIYIINRKAFYTTKLITLCVTYKNYRTKLVLKQ